MFDLHTDGEPAKNPRKVDEREVEQEGLDVEWKLKMHAWCEKKRSCENGMMSASAMIMNDYVTAGLHSKILNLDVHETELKKNAIKLLIEINKLAHDGATTTHKWKTAPASIMQMATSSQDANEHHNELQKRVSGSANQPFVCCFGPTNPGCSFPYHPLHKSCC